MRQLHHHPRGRSRRRASGGGPGRARRRWVRRAMSGPRLLRGIGVSPGVAWAPALVMRWDFPQVPDRTVTASEIEGEVRRLREAVDYVVSHLQDLGERVLRRAGPEESRI